MFSLMNDGALDVEYSIGVNGGGVDGGVDGDGRLRAGPFTLSDASGRVPGYGKASVGVLFGPTETGRAHAVLRITYRSPAQRRLFIEPHEVGTAWRCTRCGHLVGQSPPPVLLRGTQWRMRASHQITFFADTPDLRAPSLVLQPCSAQVVLPGVNNT